MEGMEIEGAFGGTYYDKNILITGHTGFKGGWLSLWLEKLGANVIGYSVDLPSDPCHFELLRLKDNIVDLRGDICDFDLINKTIEEYKPDLIFHLAAQSLVKESYSNPLLTFLTNIQGTVNTLEAAKNFNFVKGVINVTSDKCYLNNEKGIAFTEEDRFGGHDPYSASKACAELVAESYRKSFYQSQSHNLKLLACVRAGNVIGGGDWSENRLIPDLVRAVSNNKITHIRNPSATRPWQHVLDPLSGYLLIGQHMLNNNEFVSDGWNFGPEDNKALEVGDIIKRAQKHWNDISYTIDKDAQFHEANQLNLNCEKALSQLKWSPTWDTDTAIKETILWYKNFYQNNVVSTEDQLIKYFNDARIRGTSWA